jgi:hypothetical protein
MLLLYDGVIASVVLLSPSTCYGTPDVVVTGLVLDWQERVCWTLRSVAAVSDCRSSSATCCGDRTLADDRGEPVDRAGGRAGRRRPPTTATSGWRCSSTTTRSRRPARRADAAAVRLVVANARLGRAPPPAAGFRSRRRIAEAADTSAAGSRRSSGSVRHAASETNAVLLVEARVVGCGRGRLDGDARAELERAARAEVAHGVNPQR